MSLRIRVAGMDAALHAPDGLLAGICARLGGFAAPLGSHDPFFAEITACESSSSAPDLVREDLELWVEPARRRLAVRRTAGSTWEGAIDRALRFAYASWLPEHGGVLLHASAARCRHGVVAFAGGSRSGKSTVAGQFASGTVLTDDTIALRFEDGSWIAHATPFVNWQYDVPVPRSAPLWRVFAIEQSARDAIVDLNPVARCTAIMANVVAPLPGIETGVMLELASSIARHVQVARLLRTRDASIDPCLLPGRREGSGAEGTLLSDARVALPRG